MTTAIDETTATEHFRARRFDADRTDEVITFDAALEDAPSERQLLWLDITGPLDAKDLARLAASFELDPPTRKALGEPEPDPHLSVHGQYVHIRVAAEPDDHDPRSASWLSIISTANAVLTHHIEPIGFLDDINERLKVDTTYGLLDPDAFVATILDTTVTSYFRAVDAIEDDVDRLDSRSLRDKGRDELLDELVAVRRRIAALRRLLATHRPIYAALPTVALREVREDRRDEAALAAVAERFSLAMGAVESSRDLVLGSFDIYMTRTAQRTNEVMKVLTLATVLLLPGSMIAGLLGMNVSIPLDKDNPFSFWLVVGGVLLLAMIITGTAIRRRWL
jgi:magnesium transporter